MIKEALIKKLEGDIEVAKADLKVFLEKPIGVAEHIDYVITAEKKLEALEDKMDILDVNLIDSNPANNPQPP